MLIKSIIKKKDIKKNIFHLKLNFLTHTKKTKNTTNVHIILQIIKKHIRENICINR